MAAELDRELFGIQRGSLGRFLELRSVRGCQFSGGRNRLGLEVLCGFTDTFWGDHREIGHIWSN